MNNKNIITFDDLINNMFEKEIIYFNDNLTDYQNYKILAYRNYYYTVLRSLCFEVNTLFQYLELKVFLNKMKKLLNDSLNNEHLNQIKKRILFNVIETTENIIERIDKEYEHWLRPNIYYVFNE